MTRINSAINVKRLTDEHLLAEHRELPRICSVYKKRCENDGLSSLPNTFSLGSGHVLFFANKGKFTLDRYFEIRGECLRRGFNVENYKHNWLIYDVYNDYTPTLDEEKLLTERIADRILNSKKPYWHYYGKKVTKEQSINILLNQKI